MGDQYKLVSKIYNALSSIYSLGAIPKCREAMLTDDLADVRICFLGVGHGDEAIGAAKLGAEVTVVDLSASMLERFTHQLEEESERNTESMKYPVNVVQADVMTFLGGSCGEFDKIVTHFFLNVFEPREVENVVSRIAEHLSEEGELILGDFYLSRSLRGIRGFLQRLFQRVYWYSALVIFRLMAKNPWHEIYDYDAVMERQSMIRENRSLFSVLAIPMYQSASYRKSHLDI